MVKLREKKLKNGRRSLYLDIVLNKKRSREFLKLYLIGDKIQDRITQNLAEKKRNDREKELITSSYNFNATRRKGCDFISYLEELYKKDPTYDKMNQTIRYLKKYADRIPFTAINETWFTEFEKFLSKSLAKSTINNIITVLKLAMRKAVKEKILDDNPLAGIKKHKTYSHRSYVSHEELLKLNDAVCPKQIIKDAFIFSCYTGLRLIDMEFLKWKNIYDGRIDFVQHKTDVPVNKILHQEALNILNRRKEFYQGQDSLIFNLPSRNTIHTCLKIWAANAKIEKNLTYHMSRHSFATAALSHSKDLHAVSKALGHTDMETTQIYTHIIDDDVDKAINSLPGLTPDNKVSTEQKLISIMKQLKDKGLLENLDPEIKELLENK